MEKQNGNDPRPDADRILWLAQRGRAKNNPITDAQFERFGMFPDGISGHPLMRRSWRLPEEYGTDDDGSLYPREVPRVLHLLLAPDNKACIITRVGGHPTIVHSELVYQIPEPSDQYVVKSLDLIGFAPCGTPVTLCTAWARPTIDPRDVAEASRHNRVYYGSTLLFKDAEGIESPILLPNGSVVYKNKKAELKKDGRRVEYSPDNIRELFRSNTLYGILAARENKLEIREIYSRATHSLYVDPGFHVEVYGGKIFLVYDEHILVIQQKAYGALKEIGQIHLPPGKNKGNLTELQNGTFAFTTKSLRDDLKCWKVAGELQPVFQHVSPAFERPDGSWGYYGVIDRHVSEMDFPPLRA